MTLSIVNPTETEDITNATSNGLYIPMTDSYFNILEKEGKSPSPIELQEFPNVTQ